MASFSTASATYTFEHPILGSMTGIISPETPDVVRFRAIPYARLPGRFKQSILREDLNGHTRQFRRHRYACPHSFSLDDIHSGGAHPLQEPLETSEEYSLVLEVNVPRSCLDNGRREGKLPVMTYIHGGGFMLGKIDEQHNTAYMVQHSVALSTPVIATAIQYRLGVFGFMATPDGEKNFALKDQRNALLWVQNFIDGFGGDKGRVTVFGESAGGMSICYHMLSTLPPSGPLFNRAIIMSGIVGPSTTPITEKRASEAFDKLCNVLNITDRGEAALTKVLALDKDTLIEASDTYVSQGNSFRAQQDTSFFHSDFTWDQVPQLLGECEWVDEIVVGNTAFEGQTHADMLKHLTPETFRSYLTRELSAEATDGILKAYGVTEDMDNNAFLTPAMRWCGDVVFDAPIHAFADHITTNTSKRVYRYVFDIRNPFPNAPFYQQAHHWVDVYFLFRAMQFRFPHQWLKDVSNRHAELWIKFACGDAPWSAYKQGDDGVVMVADERGEWVEKSMVEYEKMSRVDWKRVESLWAAWLENKGLEWLPMDVTALTAKP